MSKPITRITVAVEVNLVLPEETDIHKAVAVIQKSFDYHMVSRAAKVTLLRRGPLPESPNTVKGTHVYGGKLVENVLQSGTPLLPDDVPGIDLLG